jgi:hypothetical protein
VRCSRSSSNNGSSSSRSSSSSSSGSWRGSHQALAAAAAGTAAWTRCLPANHPRRRKGRLSIFSQTNRPSTHRLTHTICWGLLGHMTQRVRTICMTQTMPLFQRMQDSRLISNGYRP